MNTRSSPNAPRASRRAAASASSSSSADRATRMPRPPPPAAALTSSGYGASDARACASVNTGTTGTPASRATSLARSLSPISSTAAAGGPTNAIPAASHARASAGFSDRKP